MKCAYKKWTTKKRHQRIQTKKLPYSQLNRHLAQKKKCKKNLRKSWQVATRAFCYHWFSEKGGLEGLMWGCGGVQRERRAGRARPGQSLRRSRASFEKLRQLRAPLSFFSVINFL